MRLGTGKYHMYPLRDKEGNVTTNMDKIVKVPEEFNRDLYSSQENHDDNGRRICPDKLDIPPLTPGEVKKVFDVMQLVGIR